MAILNLTAAEVLRRYRKLRDVTAPTLTPEVFSHLEKSAAGKQDEGEHASEPNAKKRKTNTGYKTWSPFRIFHALAEGVDKANFEEMHALYRNLGDEDKKELEELGETRTAAAGSLVVP